MSVRSRYRRGAALVVALVLAFVPLPATTAQGFVYWVNTDDHSIGRAELDGSGVDQGFLRIPRDTGEYGGMLGLAVDDEANVYWSHGSSEGGAIGRAGLDGAGLDQRFVTTAGTPAGLALDDTYLYWANQTAGTPVMSGSVGRAARDGTDVDSTFIEGSPWTVAAVAVGPTHVYWANGSGLQTIGRANLDGTAPDQSFISGQSPTSAVAVNGEHVYWATGYGIGRAKLDGTDVNAAFIDTPSYGVAVDGGHIYWAAGSHIGRAKLDGSAVEPEWIGGTNRAYVAAVDDRAGTTTTLTASPSPATFGDDLTFRAQVAGGATTGVVTFTVTGEPPVPVPVESDGTAIYEPPYLLDVGDTVTASYGGDAQHGPSSDVLDVDLRAARTTMSATLVPNPATTGTPLTLTAKVRNEDTAIVPFGVVFMFVDGSAVGVGELDESGHVTATLELSKAGDHTVTARYLDSTHLPQDFTVSEQTLVAHALAPATPGVPLPTAPPAATTSTKPRRCKVPRVTGLTLTAAQRKLKKAGCRLGKVTRRTAPHARRRRVVASSPRAGKTTTGSVRLVVAR